MLPKEIPEEIEAHRDRMWRRDPEFRVEDVYTAERFIDDVGFCEALTDCRRPGPSLYVAVCGRRDAHMPRNVQKDPESRLAWTIKDDVMRRGRYFYGKLIKGHATFITPRLLPFFNALWGVPQRREKQVLSQDAQAILKIMRSEWEMATRDLREESGIRERARFDRAMLQLQKRLKIIPSDVLYEPTFTYIWSIPEARFQEQLKEKVKREVALREIARAYLAGAGMTFRGELARVTGLSSPEAGLGYWALVDEGFAERLGPGIYRLANLPSHSCLQSNSCLPSDS
ncbi:MAG TPA: hypothetical protein VM941_01830 [Pyrinomonadaceae bacterium]|jgi:hypothetical protein|nr:hypothetical protein [Pyrinomonadaceae bacterium]